MSFGKFLLGALAAGGVAAVYFLKSRKPLNFDSYCEQCIERGKEQISPDAIKTAIVLTKDETGERVIPYLYSRYDDKTVKKKRISIYTFPMSLCPANVKESIEKGEYVIKTIEKE